MRYRVRFTTHAGATGCWDGTFATLAGASMSAKTRADVTGYTYTVEEVHDAPEAKPDPTSTTEKLVGLIRDRHAEGLAKYGTTLDRGDLSPDQWTQHAIEEALDLAGYLMQLKDAFATQPGSTAAHHVEILRERVKELEAELANLKASLATAPSVPVAASEAPGEGGDSDRRRLEALERYLEGNTFRRIWKTSMGQFTAGTKFEDEHFNAPTLAALADKIAEKEAQAMTCAHEPEDTVGPVAARHCRHCGAEIEPAACAECHGGTFVTDDQGREIDCPDCNGTGCDGWRKA